MQIGKKINRTKRGRLILLPTKRPAHTRSLVAYGKRITTTPLCLLVGLLMGETGEHHSPSVPSSVQMFMPFEGAFVLSPLFPDEQELLSLLQGFQRRKLYSYQMQQ